MTGCWTGLGSVVDLYFPYVTSQNGFQDSSYFSCSWQRLVAIIQQSVRGKMNMTTFWHSRLTNVKMCTALRCLQSYLEGWKPSVTIGGGGGG